MASKSEVGHAKNVANFQDLIAFVTGYGANYNPSKNSLKLPQLQTLHTNAKNGLTTVTAATTAYYNAVNNRVEAFQDLRPLSTRLLNALAATDATPETVKDAEGFNRKIQGKRSSKTEVSLDPNLPAPDTISTSQQSYDQLIQHFSGFISLLQSEPTYTPNEDELKVVNLQAKVTDLETKNNEVSTAFTAISNARLARNKTLYNEDEGLVPIAAEVKKYVKSVYGAASPEFKQITAIKFSKNKP